ncbi:MAG TPA: hypothetical protein VFG89_10100 [Coriobacteriia bacterium]|nr:hypothetical protein [Coriobacteriia bacterium]
MPDEPRSGWPDAAILVASTTAYGYLISFLYQYGRANYYGYPPEYNSTSQQWVLFVAAALVLVFGSVWLSASVLGAGFARSLHSVVIRPHHSPVQRLRRRILLLVVFGLLFVATLVWALATTPPFGRVVGVVFVMTGLALMAAVETTGSPGAFRWLAVAAFGAMVLAGLAGYGMAAYAEDHYRVAGTNLVVLSIEESGKSLVVAPYDSSTRMISSQYSLLRSTETSPVVLEWIKTGMLRVSAPK